MSCSIVTSSPSKLKIAVSIQREVDFIWDMLPALLGENPGLPNPHEKSWLWATQNSPKPSDSQSPKHFARI